MNPKRKRNVYEAVVGQLWIFESPSFRSSLAPIWRRVPKAEYDKRRAAGKRVRKNGRETTKRKAKP